MEWAEVSALLWDVSCLDSLDPILVERLLSEQIKILEKLPGKIKLSFLNLYSGDLNTRLVSFLNGLKLFNCQMVMI